MDHNAPANPQNLDPFNEEGTLQVVIETPRGSRNKYSWDERRRCFQMKKILPAGMVFPFDFGFVPSTLADDGGAIDVLLLMDEPAFPGCVVNARLIGVFEAEDTLPNGNTQRNDRLVAVAKPSQIFADIHHINDLPGDLRSQLEHFFRSYPSILHEKEVRILQISGPEQALKLIEATRQSAS
jgi:inorganic pyrophosphatase